jgi:hypothetical protein
LSTSIAHESVSFRLEQSHSLSCTDSEPSLGLFSLPFLGSIACIVLTGLDLRDFEITTPANIEVLAFLGLLRAMLVIESNDGLFSVFGRTIGNVGEEWSGTGVVAFSPADVTFAERSSTEGVGEMVLIGRVARG